MKLLLLPANSAMPALQLAENPINKPGVLSEELALAAGFLRVVLIRRLRQLATGKQLALPFTIEPQKIGIKDLWGAMAVVGWPAKRNARVAGINVNAPVLLDAWTWPGLLSVNVGQLQAAMQAVKRH